MASKGPAPARSDPIAKICPPGRCGILSERVGSVYSARPGIPSVPPDLYRAIFQPPTLTGGFSLARQSREDGLEPGTPGKVKLTPSTPTLCLHSESGMSPSREPRGYLLFGLAQCQR
jgi:hypothetical protein